MSDTPETQEAVERWQQGKINIFDEMSRLERERDEARAELNEWQTLRLWGAEPHNIHEFIHGQQARIHEAQDVERERDQWKADCLEQCQLLAQSADREEKLIAKTGYWESLIHWLELVQKAFEGQDRDWDMTQLYVRGPFAGWSQSEMVKLADKLWENEQKHPLRGDKK